MRKYCSALSYFSDYNSPLSTKIKAKIANAQLPKKELIRLSVLDKRTSECVYTYKFSRNATLDHRPWSDPTLETLSQMETSFQDLYSATAEKLHEFDDRVFLPAFKVVSGEIIRFSRYGSFLSKQNELAKSYGNICAVTDIVSMYPSICQNSCELIDYVFKSVLRIPSSVVSSVIKSIVNVKGGLPLGHPLSELISRLVMLPIDQQLTEWDFGYCRIQDDFRIFTHSHSEAQVKLTKLKNLLWEFLLRVNTSKTFIHSAEALETILSGIVPLNTKIWDYYEEVEVEDDLSGTEIQKADLYENNMKPRKKLICDKLYTEVIENDATNVSSHIESMFYRECIREKPIANYLDDLIRRPHLYNQLGRIFHRNYNNSDIRTRVKGHILNDTKLQFNDQTGEANEKLPMQITCSSESARDLGCNTIIVCDLKYAEYMLYKWPSIETIGTIAEFARKEDGRCKNKLMSLLRGPDPEGVYLGILDN